MEKAEPIRVLLIEDDPMVQEVNRMFIEKIEGFVVIGMALNGEKGRRLVDELQPDLVLLDVFMAKEDGLTVIKKLREDQLDVDIIAVTAANDTKTVKMLLRYGVVDYIVKPFTFERLSQALNLYKNMHGQLGQKVTISQNKLDSFLHKEKVVIQDVLPKGVQEQTLKEIHNYLKTIVNPQSAEEISSKVGLARVTVGRYLNYLVSINEIKMMLSYGTVGRPIQLYQIVLKNRGN